MTQHRFHASCITTQLINIAKMNPKMASFACEEANRLNMVGRLLLSEIIQPVGPGSAAQYDAFRAAHVLNQNEFEIRVHPDTSYFGQEPYNKRLKRLVEERKRAHYKKLRDRDLRKEQLPHLEHQFRALKAQIERDEQEIEEATADTTKQPDRTLKNKIEEEEETEKELQEYVKAREEKQ